jgi:hypothetical protein
MKQTDEVLVTLERLGGQATLAQLYREVPIKGWHTKTPFASIRRIVQMSPDIFKVRPGLWALRAYKQKLGLSEYTRQGASSKAEAEQGHSYYQGLIATVGNLRGFKTFIPHQDQNKLCVSKPLGEIRTLPQLPPFSHDSLVRRSSTIDVLWFNQRLMPDSMFEVEHSTDIQNSLVKFDDLQDFHARMIIVADERRRVEYQQKVDRSALAAIRDRVKFLGYDSLVRQYENEVFKASQDFVL